MVTGCFHCGEPLPEGAPILARIRDEQQPVCCVGCRAVAEFIDSSGLNAFYRFRDQPTADMNLKAEPGSWQRFDEKDLQNRYVCSNGTRAEATIDIGGMYCSACVWLLDNALQRLDGVDTVDVSPATRRAVIRWQSDTLAFSELLEAIARVGFKPAPVAAGNDAAGKDDEYKRALKRLIVAAAAGMQVMMFAVGLYAGDFFGIEKDLHTFLRTISMLVSVPIVFYAARPFFTGAWRGVRASQPGMDLPVSIAILAAFLASVYATLADRGDVYFDSVAMFVLFLSATRFLEMRARHRSDDHALALARLLPDTATRIVDGEARAVLLDELRPGDTVSIRPGDIVPADGEIDSGELSADVSLLTGESLPEQRGKGETVLAGAIVRRGNALLRVTRTGASTSLAEIARLLDRAKADRPPVAVLADRIASYFVVGVLLVTAAAALSWYFIDPARAFEVALATLVVTCPCALALATPAAIAAATGRLARDGFLLVRSRILEVMNRADVIVFDKTGTLTKGRPVVVGSEVFAGAALWNDDLLALAAELETASEHVLARAFNAFYVPGRYRARDVEAVAGAGVQGTIDGVRYRLGAAAFAAGRGDDGALPEHSGHTAVYLSDDERVLARFDVGDELRSDARATIDALRDAGYEPVIASGDREAVVARVARELGIEKWHAALSPSAKLELLNRMRAAGKTVVMVGDGVNDAPVLAAADASVALDAGTALARASADAVSLGRTLGSLVTAARVSASTARVIRQNIAWAILYNLTAVPLAVSGLLSPWMAATGMSLSSFVVITNALRLHRVAKHVTDESRTTGDAKLMRERLT